MTTNIIENLEKRIEKEQTDLQLLMSMKEAILPIASIGEENTAAVGVPLYLKGLINHTKKSIKGLKSELEYQRQARNNKRIEVMFFKAGHRGFDSDEITQMLLDFRKFKQTPIEKDIDFGMSDEAKMFVSEDVAQKEAENMWKYFCHYSFDKHDNVVMEYGDLLVWNGIEFIDENNVSFDARK